MHKMTEDNLKAALAGESQAHLKYLAFADKAEAEGKPQIARLFRAIAYAERVHATNHLKTLGGLGNTAANVEAAIGGETYEVEEMYAAFVKVAEMQGEKAALRSFTWAQEAEKIHIGLYEKAKAALTEGKDLEAQDVYICEVCGYTAEGQAPERCPLCGVSREKFRKF